MIYLLYYDIETDDKTDWSVFYCPCEAFSSDHAREERMNELKADPEFSEYEFYTDVLEVQH